MGWEGGSGNPNRANAKSGGRSNREQTDQAEERSPGSGGGEFLGQRGRDAGDRWERRRDLHLLATGFLGLQRRVFQFRHFRRI